VPDPAYVLEQYEALRREALEVAPFAPRGHGLALVIARGLPAWLTALTTLAPSRPTRTGDDGVVPPGSRLQPAARMELTTVLAGMVLACARPQEGAS
jgi:hypothetical protein